MTTSWTKIDAGHYAKQVSLTGTYHAECVGRRWTLRYEGGTSATVGEFVSLQAAKDYVARTTS